MRVDKGVGAESAKKWVAWVRSLAKHVIAIHTRHGGAAPQLAVCSFHHHVNQQASCESFFLEFWPAILFLAET
jgi:hypothetical protein